MPRSVSLSFELLQTFVSLICQEGDAAAVMRELELIQPTLSKRLKYLQHAGPLLDRSNFWDALVIVSLSHTRPPVPCRRPPPRPRPAGARSHAR